MPDDGRQGALADAGGMGSRPGTRDGVSAMPSRPSDGALHHAGSCAHVRDFEGAVHTPRV